jgi:hypothetical protein
LGTPSESEAEQKQPQQKKPTSEAQRLANVANAKKSTGPRSTSGKEASSKNSLKHGLYQKSLAPIPDGPFAGDAEEVGAFVEEIVNDLQPRDGAEFAVANKIAQVMLRGERFERAQGSLFSAATTIASETWGEHRGDLDAARDLVDYLEDPERLKGPTTGSAV